jgi:predicted acetyltransferase
MGKKTPRLVLPDHAYATSYIEALKEGHYRGIQPKKTAKQIEAIEKDLDKHFEEVNKQGGAVRTPTGEVLDRVPYNLFWLVEGAQFIGEAIVTYRTNDFILSQAGQVGYGIRPSMKRKGYGNLILKLSLEKLKERGVKRALVTCNEHNIASMKIIEANGGVLENKVPSVFHEGSLMRRYWIELGEGACLI